MMTLEEAIEQYANTAVFCKMHESEKYAAEFKQLAAWLRELAERRKADSCEGCMHRYGERLTCQLCARYYFDKYVAERKTDK